MEMKQVEKLLDCYVMYGTQKVIVRGWMKGWIEIEMADNAEVTKKVRSKELFAIPGGYEDGNNHADQEGSEEIVATTKVNEAPPEMDEKELTEYAKEKKAGKLPFDASMGVVDCPKCQHCITLKEGQRSNVRCSNCSHVFAVRLHPNLEHYTTGLGTTASGRDTVDVADEMAAELRGMGPEELYPFAASRLEEIGMECAFSKNMKGKFNKSGLDIETFLKEKYQGLNNGMQRMNIGNLLRGAVARCSKANGEQ